MERANELPTARPLNVNAVPDPEIPIGSVVYEHEIAMIS